MHFRLIYLFFVSMFAFYFPKHRVLDCFFSKMISGLLKTMLSGVRKLPLVFLILLLALFLVHAVFARCNANPLFFSDSSS